MAVCKAKQLAISPIKLDVEAHFQGNQVFKNAFLYSAIGMALVSLEGNWLKVNVKICRLVGYSEDELLKLTFQDITHPDDLDLDLKYLQQMIEEKIQNYNMEKRYLHKNKEIIWLLLSVSLVRNNNGEPLFCISQVSDFPYYKTFASHIENFARPQG